MGRTGRQSLVSSVFSSPERAPPLFGFVFGSRRVGRRGRASWGGCVGPLQRESSQTRCLLGARQLEGGAFEIPSLGAFYLCPLECHTSAGMR